MSDFNQRFATRIPWVMFRNDSGQTIPPYSVVSAAQWFYPAPADPFSGSSLSPFFSGVQPGGQGPSSTPYSTTAQPINPYALYITGREATPPTSGPGPNGTAARPDVYPQVVSLQGQTGGGGTALNGFFAGVFSPQWGLSLYVPGFTIVATMNGGYAAVRTGPCGPYVGQIAPPPDGAGTQLATNSSGPVQFMVSVVAGASGPIGQETAAPGVVIPNVYNRFAPIDVGDWCLFDWTGQGWEILNSGGGGTLQRGTLNAALSDGGSAIVAGIDDNTYTIHEVLGLNGGSIPSGKKVWFTWNPVTSQYEVISAGC